MGNIFGQGIVRQLAGGSGIASLDAAEYASQVSADSGSLESVGPVLATFQSMVDAGTYYLSTIVVPLGAGYKNGTGGVSGKIYYWNPQTRTIGSLDVDRTSTKTRVNANGIIESVPINSPAQDFLNGRPGDFTIEEQRTNLVTYSEDFSNAAWNKLNSSITANSVASPDGAITADEIVEDATTNSHNIIQSITVSSGITYTTTVFFKANTRTKAAIQLAGGAFAGGGNGIVIFDLSAGTVVSELNGATGTIKAYANGWYKCTATKISAGTGGIVSINLVDASNNLSYAGDGTSGLYVWGTQVEEGAYPSSYIPTVASAVTRNKDDISLSGAAALLGDSEGGMFLELSWFDTSSVSGFRIGDGTSDNRYSVYSFVNELYQDLVIDSVAQSVPEGGTLVSNVFTKIAIRYALNDGKAYQDGVSISTADTIDTFSNATLSQIDFIASSSLNAFYGRIRQLVIFDQAASNTQLSNQTS